VLRVYCLEQEVGEEGQTFQSFDAALAAARLLLDEGRPLDGSIPDTAEIWSAPVGSEPPVLAGRPLATLVADRDLSALPAD
jgi:hypothetical protein